MDIPADIEIRSSIQPGSVYYFRSDSLNAPYPHYFIVVNRNPLTDSIVLLLCATSKVDKTRIRHSNCPPETLVIIERSKYPEFKFKSVINCNSIFEVTIQQLVKKREQGLLWPKPPMSIATVEALRRGIIASPLVERRVKALLSDP